jgi:hypothetical protein
MTRMWQVTALAAAAFVFSACATMHVSSHVARDLDFSNYRTYDWGVADQFPAGDPRLDRDPFFQDHLQGAIEKQLARKGFVRSSDGPDLVLHYHAVINRRLNVDRLDRERGYCFTPDCVVGPVGPVGVDEYESGTLIVDVVDARTDRVVWRGWAEHSVEDMLASRDRMATTIDRAVERILARFPGGR